jgi:hypothetical protein
MAKGLTEDLRKWALLGAEQRLNQLTQEIAAIRAAFPELGGGRRISRGKSSAAPRRWRRRKLGAEARKRISDAQKARWAKQKAGKK